MCPGQGSPAAANASLLIGAVAIASILPARASSTARTMASYAARPAAAVTRPRSNGSDVTGPYTTGSQMLSTPASPAAFAVISGPMPAGSPAVIPIRGRLFIVRIAPSSAALSDV